MECLLTLPSTARGYFMEKCVYCGKILEKRSREHIIQNALGGLLMSENICCDECNNLISKIIGAPFTKIFNPIIANLKNMIKSNNTKSYPVCEGIAYYDNQKYNVKIKNKKVVSCPEISEKMHCKISDLDFESIEYIFYIDKAIFKQGVAKIAFNYALEKNVKIDVLMDGLKIKKCNEKIQDISFDYYVVPFMAMNSIDKYIELETELEVYHNLILFSQCNRLWCYVDLFNTFQYYVLLSQNWDEKKSIFESYMQGVQKKNREIFKQEVLSTKDIHTLALQYNVKSAYDMKKLYKDINNKILQQPNELDMSKVIFNKFDDGYDDYYMNINSEQRTQQNDVSMIIELKLYFNENGLIKENFREVTCDENNEIVSYPEYIYLKLKEKEKDLQDYTMKKFKRLNDYLMR